MDYKSAYLTVELNSTNIVIHYNNMCDQPLRTPQESKDIDSYDSALLLDEMDMPPSPLLVRSTAFATKAVQKLSYPSCPMCRALIKKTQERSIALEICMICHDESIEAANCVNFECSHATCKKCYGEIVRMMQ